MRPNGLDKGAGSAATRDVETDSSCESEDGAAGRKGRRMVCHASADHDQAGAATFMPDKADFRTRTISGDKITNEERVKSPRRPHDSKYARTANGPSDE